MYYFDDEEIGLARKTSHPKFNEIIEDEFYYDLTDDFSPFGNDTGAEILLELSEWVQENQHDKGIQEWMFDYIDSFGFEYESQGVSQLDNIEDINQVIHEDEFMINCMDQAIIATGFGQLKITGKINAQLLEITKKAINRQIQLNMQTLSTNKVDIGKIVKMVDGVSTRPNELGETNHLTKLFIERMKIMKRDLDKLN